MKNTALNFTLAALLAVSTTLHAAPQYSCDLTFTGYSGSAPLANFPVLVRLADASPPGFTYRQLRADGADLSFRDASGNLIECEIET